MFSRCLDIVGHAECPISKLCCGPKWSKLWLYYNYAGLTIGQPT